MTKKNVAALMLAGAMMTVGSGAMAAQNFTTTNDPMGGDIDVTISASSSETVDVTVNWAWKMCIRDRPTSE